MRGWDTEFNNVCEKNVCIYDPGGGTKDTTKNFTPNFKLENGGFEHINMEVLKQ